MAQIMKEISIFVGGKARDGIRQADHVIAWLPDRFGYVAILACDSLQQGVS